MDKICRPCPQKCKSCSNEYYLCSECYPGFRGVSCNLNCNNTCGGDRSCLKDFPYTCNISCQDGVQCQQCPPQCNAPCIYSKGHVNCSSCTKSNTYDSDCKLCPIGCSSCQGPDAYCISCQAGFSGDQCQGICPEGCNEVVTGFKCSKQNNQIICNNGCKPLYYGPDCKPCGSNCVKCDNYGTCRQCKVGFYGETCALTCPSGCGGNDKCSAIQNVLTCAQGCDKGYYGDDCNNTCPAHCYNRQCEQKTGTCLNCDDGYYGDRCDQRCDHCSNDDACFQNNGTCVHGCDDGYYGDACSDTCSFNCYSGQCQRTTGKCFKCVSGHYGNMCYLSCDNIGGTCCNPSTGDCISCFSGYFGKKCQYNCTAFCLGGDGSCAFGDGAITRYLPNPPDCNTIREYTLMISIESLHHKFSVSQ